MPQGQPTGQVLATVAGGALTIPAAEACIEALEFCLAQVGNPARFDWIVV